MIKKASNTNHHNLIVITGTPGTGKSTLATFLAKELNYTHLDVHDYYRQLATGFSQEKDCYDIDLDKFTQLVTTELEKHNLIVDTHIAHLLPKELVTLCIVTTCSDIALLKQRLEARKYSKEKVRENLDAELLHTCLEDAQDEGHEVIVIDTATGFDEQAVLEKIRNFLSKSF